MSAVNKTHPIEFPYAESFQALQKTIRAASTKAPGDLNLELAKFHRASSNRITATDEEFYQKLVKVVFYSGMSAQKVTARMDRILFHLGDFRKTALYSSRDIARIGRDKEMLRHKGKINACVYNARQFLHILHSYPTVGAYFNAFGPFTDEKKICSLKRKLREDFMYLGPITVYHYLMDMGLHMVKPDRVLQRIFFRLGLTKDPKNARSAQERD